MDLEEKEIDKTILKSTDREYNYLCKRPDIKKYCDASACTRHVCGITPQEALDYPRFSVVPWDDEEKDIKKDTVLIESIFDNDLINRLKQIFSKYKSIVLLTKNKILRIYDFIPFI